MRVYEDVTDTKKAVLRDAVDELIPGIARDGLRGGTYSLHDGQVSPLLLPVVLMRHAEALGAELRVKERVTGYLIEGGAIQGVRTDQGVFYAPRVVLAAGAEAADHSELLGIEIPVVPDSHEAGITAPVEHFIKPLAQTALHRPRTRPRWRSPPPRRELGP